MFGLRFVLLSRSKNFWLTLNAEVFVLFLKYHLSRLWGRLDLRCLSWNRLKANKDDYMFCLVSSSPCSLKKLTTKSIFWTLSFSNIFCRNLSNLIFWTSLYITDQNGALAIECSVCSLSIPYIQKELRQTQCSGFCPLLKYNLSEFCQFFAPASRALWFKSLQQQRMFCLTLFFLVKTKIYIDGMTCPGLSPPPQIYILSIFSPHPSLRYFVVDSLKPAEILRMFYLFSAFWDFLLLKIN